MERMKKTVEDFETELRKMGATDEAVEKQLESLQDVMLSFLPAVAMGSDEIKANAVRQARQQTVLVLRAIKHRGVNEYDMERDRFESGAYREETFEAFSDVNWDDDDF